MEHDQFEEVNIGKPLKKRAIAHPYVVLGDLCPMAAKDVFFVDTGDKDWWIGCSRALSFLYKMVPPQL